MKKTLTQQLKEANEAIVRLETVLISKQDKLDAYVAAGKKRTELLQIKESQRNNMLAVENAKLWYMLRHYAGDDRMKTRIVDKYNNDGEPQQVDPFYEFIHINQS